VARGVLYHDARGGSHMAYLNHGARNEIILSAGALGSPQLLMLSGVGPADAIYVPSPSPVELSLIQVVGITRFGSYIEGASGSDWNSRTSGAAAAQVRSFGMFSPQTGQLATVPPKQRTPEAIARAVEAMRQVPDAALRGGFILEKVLGPQSTGRLALRNLDPDDNPTVSFNYFSHPDDLRRCAAGIATIERVIRSRAFSRFAYPNFAFPATINVTAEFPANLMRMRGGSDPRALEQFCRDTVMTIWHYHAGEVGGGARAPLDGDDVPLPREARHVLRREPDAPLPRRRLPRHPDPHVPPAAPASRLDCPTDRQVAGAASRRAGERAAAAASRARPLQLGDGPGRRRQARGATGRARAGAGTAPPPAAPRARRAGPAGATRARQRPSMYVWSCSMTNCFSSSMSWMMSRIETTPTTAPPSSTSRWRVPWSRMSAAHSASLASALTRGRPGRIASRTGMMGRDGARRSPPDTLTGRGYTVAVPSVIQPVTDRSDAQHAALNAAWRGCIDRFKCS